AVVHTLRRIALRIEHRAVPVDAMRVALEPRDDLPVLVGIGRVAKAVVDRAIPDVERLAVDAGLRSERMRVERTRRLQRDRCRNVAVRPIVEKTRYRA